MVIIDRRRVGAVVCDRLVRDRIVRPLPFGACLAPGVPLTRGLRAKIVSGALPTGGAVAGVAALWVHAPRAEFWPTSIEVAVRRGSNPGPPVAWGFPWTSAADTLAMSRWEYIDGVPVVSVADAVAGALARAPLGEAIAGAWSVRELVDHTAVEARIGRLTPLAERRRAMSAWRELVAATAWSASRQ